MAYAPRQRKYKVRWKIAVPLILLVALVLYAVAGLLFPQKKEEAKKFTVCGLDKEGTVKLLNASSKGCRYDDGQGLCLLWGILRAVYADI